VTGDGDGGLVQSLGLCLTNAVFCNLGLVLRCRELPTEFFIFQAELLYLFRRWRGLLVLGKPVPDLFPATISLKVDTKDIDQGEQKRLLRELPPGQHVAQGGAPEPSPPELGARQQPVRVLRAVLKFPQRRPVSPHVELSQACGQLVEAARGGGVEVIHVWARFKKAVRSCPLMSANGTAATPRCALRCPRHALSCPLFADKWHVTEGNR
jgi:hypothetical protein